MGLLMDATSDAADAAASNVAAAAEPASFTTAAALASSSAASPSASAEASDLVEAVVQVKRQRLHLNLTASDVGRVLRAEGSRWAHVSDTRLRRALTAANKELGTSSGAAPDVYTWRCSMVGWTAEQLSALQAVGASHERVHKAVIDARADAQLSAVFVFGSHWTARRLCEHVRPLNAASAPPFCSMLADLMRWHDRRC